MLPSLALMKMRQSLAELEEAFHQETQFDRKRRHYLREQAVARSRSRRVEQVHKSGSVRFLLLAMSMVATAIIVTIIMFETLYVVMG